MGWLSKVRDAAVERGVRDPRFERDVAAWERWAAEHGWTYQAEAPELVGRYEPEYRDGAELYHHLLTTRLHGFRATAFEHRTSSLDSFSKSRGEAELHRHVKAFIVLQLPGLPPEEFVRMGPEKGIRKLGGEVPNGHDLRLLGDELVAHRDGPLDPKGLQAAELLALQVAAVPASFWRPASSSGGPTV